MKKMLVLVIIIAILYFCMQFGITLLKKSHDIKYEIQSGETTFSVHEVYSKTSHNDFYMLEISHETLDFILKIDNHYNKRKEIIKSINYYKNSTDNLECISVQYIKEDDGDTIVCNKDGINLSYSAVMTQYDIDFTKVFNNIDLSRYIDDTSSFTNYKNTKVYLDNMEDEILLLYFYKDIARIKGKEIDSANFSVSDVYQNDLGRLADNYYIIPMYTMSPGYTKIYTFNIASDKIKTNSVKIAEGIMSSNTYINGIVNGKVYMFDRSNKIQYEINPNTDYARVVGNESLGGQYYYNGKWSTVSIYDLANDDVLFSEAKNIPEISTGKYKEFFEAEDCYYYYNNENEFYKVYKEYSDIPLLLFKTNDIKEVNIVDDNIYFISDETLYRYNSNGLKTLIYNTEFQHNYRNIYSVY